MSINYPDNIAFAKYILERFKKENTKPQDILESLLEDLEQMIITYEKHKKEKDHEQY